MKIIEIDFESIKSSHATGGYKVAIDSGHFYRWFELGFWGRLGRPELEISTIPELTVSVEGLSSALIFHDPDGLQKLVVFQILCDGGELFYPADSNMPLDHYQSQYFNSLSNFKFKGPGTKKSGNNIALGFRYNLFLDLSQVKDYTNIDNDIYLTVKFHCKSDPTALASIDQSDHVYPLHLVLRHAKPNAALRFELDDVVKKHGIYYRSQGVVCIGFLQIENNSSLQFSTPLHANISVSGKASPKGIILGTSIEDASGLLLDKIQKTALPNIVEVKGLLRGQKILAPVFIDFESIPTIDKDVLIETIEAQNESRDIAISPDIVSFRILPSRLQHEVVIAFKEDKSFKGGAQHSPFDYVTIGLLTVSTQSRNKLSFPLDFEIRLNANEGSVVDQRVCFQENSQPMVRYEGNKIIFINFNPGDSMDIPVMFFKGDIQPTGEAQPLDLSIFLHGGGVEKKILHERLYFRAFIISQEFSVLLKLDPDFQDGYRYKPAQGVPLGTLYVSRTENTAYAGAISAVINFAIAPFVQGGFAIKHDGAESGSTCELLDKQTIKIQNWQASTKLVIPIYVNLNHFPESETTEQDYCITAKVECFGWADEIATQHFTIKPKQYPTQLKMSILDADGKVVINDWLDEHAPPTLHLDKPTVWMSQEQRSRTPIFSVFLSNRAKHGDGVVKITSFTAGFKLQEEKTELLPEDFIYVSLDDDIDVHPITYLENKKFNINDGEKPIKLNFILNQSNLTLDSSIYEVKIAFDIKCTYQLIDTLSLAPDAITSDTRRKTGSFPVQRFLGDHWLALDLGTSAIVAAFDDGNNPDVQLFDLQSVLKRYYLEEGVDLGNEKPQNPMEAVLRKSNKHSLHKEDYTDKEIREFNTPFLDSNIILRPKAELNAPSWFEDIVHLSALIREQTNSSYTVPYLKSLIGADFINKYNRAFDNFEYKLDGKPVKNVDKHKIDVKTILSNTYRIVFRDFVKNKINHEKQQDKFNKIIATYPNTFSPKHLDLIRAIIQEEAQLPNPDTNLIFLSESDAVAQYYLSNRKKYNANRPKDKIFDKTTDGKELEYLLVYDIGAGTLDLTLMKMELEISEAMSSIRGKVEIVGRLGKNTAGNYFDYVLAKALFDIVSKGEIDVDTIRAKGERYDIKTFVRDQLKPNLDKGSPGTFKLSDPIKKILNAEEGPTDRELLEHPMVEAYFKENTYDVFNNFFRLLEPNLPLEQTAKFPIHTVLISGRASQVATLRNNIESAIETISTAKGGAFIVNADTILSATSIGAQNIKLKGIVAQGAIRHATKIIRQERPSIEFKNKNVLASYGFLYGDAGQSDIPWKYVEMLSPHIAPEQENPAKIKDGLWIYTYDVKRELNLEDATLVKFVQSFTPETAKMYNEEKREYITEIVSISTSRISNQRNVPVRVRINAENRMVISIGTLTLEPESPLAVDLFNSETFKRSMWPHYDPI